MRGFLRRHRLALILVAVTLVFFVIGASAPRTSIPLMCRIYG